MPYNTTEAWLVAKQNKSARLWDRSTQLYSTRLILGHFDRAAVEHRNAVNSIRKGCLALTRAEYNYQHDGLTLWITTKTTYSRPISGITIRI